VGRGVRVQGSTPEPTPQGESGSGGGSESGDPPHLHTPRAHTAATDTQAGGGWTTHTNATYAGTPPRGGAYVNPTPVYVNPTQVYVNPTQVYVNPTQVYANRTQVGVC
jgi:hypothetical protein